MRNAMNDPWDVKSVRQSGQYISCMKINGVPLLPPVLSKECRKEMQYYKLLAKEVEKRIILLKPYAESETDSSDDKTDAPELPECEQSYELPPDEVQAGFNVNIEKITAVTCDKLSDKSMTDPLQSLDITNDMYNNITSNIMVVNALDTASPGHNSKFVIDLSLSINETGRNVLETVKKSPQHTQHTQSPIDLPERDYNCPKKLHKKEILTDVDTVNNGKQKDKIEEVVSFSFSVNKEDLNKPGLFPDLSLNQDGPSSLSSKSFTGSLNDIHSGNVKESQITPKLIRQRSYTVLKPSPQLLAHLEVQSLCTGVEMTSISMSESLSNVGTLNKKRRSWDLESAKAKWSNMALELKQKTSVNNPIRSEVAKTHVARPITKKSPQTSPPRARSVVHDRSRRGSLNNRPLTKSDPIQKPKKQLSPLRNIPSNRTIVKEPVTAKHVAQKKESDSPKHEPPLISESDDPATRVRELYEKVQKQQLIQMASLVEKQKREQMLLQQVFEEQNTLLYKQLKTICPKSPIEAKEAWGEKAQETVGRGPVSLSQLINHKSPEQRKTDSPISSTLTDTNKYINHCDNVLKKSRDITSSIKKQQPKVSNQNVNKTHSTRSQPDGSRTRTQSPNYRNCSTSRRLNYDTSASSDKEYDPALTDRTNDTMADLNVTFPSDHSDDFSYNHNGTVVNNTAVKNVTSNVHSRSVDGACNPTDTAIRCMEETIQNSMKNMCTRTLPNNKQNTLCYQPTPQQRAAASKIVAYAKGFLVRRLMRTERVQGTVQTIRDALLCALQLHQDREGIRGADVDLHRRLIQQITAACYSLHETFVASTPAERCAIIAADRDRGRRRSIAARQTARHFRQTDVMSQSHTGSFPSRVKRAPPSSLMTQSNYETFSGAKCGVSGVGGGSARVGGWPASPRRRPWR